jgi:hypothetical protein
MLRTPAGGAGGACRPHQHRHCLLSISVRTAACAASSGGSALLMRAGMPAFPLDHGCCSALGTCCSVPDTCCCRVLGTGKAKGTLGVATALAGTLYLLLLLLCCMSTVYSLQSICEQRHFCVGKGSWAPAAGGGPQQEGLKPLVRCMQVGGVEAPPTPVHWTSQIAEDICVLINNLFKSSESFPKCHIAFSSHETSILSVTTQVVINQKIYQIKSDIIRCTKHPCLQHVRNA